MSTPLGWVYTLVSRVLWRPKRQMQKTPPRVAFRRPWPGTRRGLKLWLFSIIIGLKGLGYLTHGGPGSTDSALRLPTHFLPLEFWGGLIVAICAVSAFCSFCHFGRDRYGYMLLVGFSMGWTACYIAAPLFLGGPLFALQGALSWALIALFLIFSAGDPVVPAMPEAEV